MQLALGAARPLSISSIKQGKRFDLTTKFIAFMSSASSRFKDRHAGRISVLVNHADETRRGVEAWGVQQAEAMREPIASLSKFVFEHGSDGRDNAAHFKDTLQSIVDFDFLKAKMPFCKLLGKNHYEQIDISLAEEKYPFKVMRDNLEDALRLLTDRPDNDEGVYKLLTNKHVVAVCQAFSSDVIPGSKSFFGDAGKDSYSGVRNTLQIFVNKMITKLQTSSFTQFAVSVTSPEPDFGSILRDVLSHSEVNAVTVKDNIVRNDKDKDCCPLPSLAVDVNELFQLYAPMMKGATFKVTHNGQSKRLPLQVLCSALSVFNLCEHLVVIKDAYDSEKDRPLFSDLTPLTIANLQRNSQDRQPVDLLTSSCVVRLGPWFTNLGAHYKAVLSITRDLPEEHSFMNDIIKDVVHFVGVGIIDTVALVADVMIDAQDFFSKQLNSVVSNWPLVSIFEAEKLDGTSVSEFCAAPGARAIIPMLPKLQTWCGHLQQLLAGMHDCGKSLADVAKAGLVMTAQADLELLVSSTKPYDWKALEGDDRCSVVDLCLFAGSVTLSQVLCKTKLAPNETLPGAVQKILSQLPLKKWQAHPALIKKSAKLISGGNGKK